MLGWFKNKLKKKEADSSPEAAEKEEAVPGLEQEEAAETRQPESGIISSLLENSEELEVLGYAVKEEDRQERSAADRQADAAEPEQRQEQPAPSEAKKNKSLFRHLQDRLDKTRKTLVYRLDTLFLGKKEIDQELFDDLEEILITADLGVATTQELLDDVRIEVRRQELQDPQVLKTVLKEKILAYLVESDRPAELVMPEKGPFVIMVIGVNGVGKTTSIGKIAAKFVRAGRSVLLVAGDTFRAAAIDQLKIWAQRCNVDIIAQKQGSDPSSVVYDALEYGAARNFDVIIVDTAGRLHTQVNLMEELKKIKRVMHKKLPGAPHEVMLVLDATTGQNGISQARMFNEAVAITGLTLTKLDGTAKGGIVVNISRQLNIPVRFIGIGEQIDDLRDFNPDEFVDALFGENSRKSEIPA